MTISCIISAIGYLLLNYRTHYYDNSAISEVENQIKLRIKISIAAKKFKKIPFKKSINFFVFVRKFLTKTILTSFDFMQNFNFILT